MQSFWHYVGVPCQSCSPWRPPRQSLCLVTSPTSLGLLSQLLSRLGCALLLTVISAVLGSGDGGNGSRDPSFDLSHRGDPEPFSFPSLCPKRCYSVTQTSLAVALLGITRPLDMPGVGYVSAVVSLKPYSFSVFKTATFVPIPYSYCTFSCSNNRQFSWRLHQLLINWYVLWWVLLVTLLRAPGDPWRFQQHNNSIVNVLLHCIPAAMIRSRFCSDS